MADYLTAAWIRNLKNAPRRSVLGLFFAKSHGRTVLVPSRAAIAAWVASADTDYGARVREWLLDAKPQILLTKGDPQQLPVPFRERMLEALIAKYAGRSRVRIDSDPAQLRRIATPELADMLARRIADGALSVDLRELLLGIAFEGRLSGCVPAALDVLRAPVVPHSSMQTDALAVVGRAGTVDQLRDAWGIVSVNPAPSDALCQQAIRDLYPKVMSIGDVVSMLQKAPSVELDGMRHMEYRLLKFVDDGKFDRDVEEFLAGIVHLLNLQPHWIIDQRTFPVSQRHTWLDVTLLHTCKRLLARQTLSPALADKLGEAAALLAICKRVDHQNDRKFDLHAETEAHPLVRKFYVLHRYEGLRRINRADADRLAPLTNLDGVVRPSRVDLPWLAELLRDASDPSRRTWLLSLALTEWEWLRRPRGWLRKLRASVSGEPELLARIPSSVSPTVFYLVARLRWHVAYELRWKIQTARRRVPARVREALLWARIWLAAGKIRTAEYDGWLRYLVHDKEVRGSSTELSDVPRERLIAAYGKRVGSAVWDGMKRYWRLKDAPPRSGNEIPVAAVIGLPGVQAAVEDGLDFQDLDDTLARRAAMLATHELNGFPSWASALFAAKASVVKPLFDEAFAREWAIPTNVEHVHELVAKLRYDSSGAARGMASALRDKLNNAEPLHPKVLRDAIAVIFKEERCHPSIAALAPVRIAQYQLGQPQFFAWFAAWMAVDAVPAIDYLERAIAPLNPAAADSIVVGISAGLSERRSSDVPNVENPSYLRLPAVTRLISLVCRHVRTDQDIDRGGGGVYTPTTRDHAGQFRGALFGVVSELEHPGAYAALQTLAADPVMTRHREWILHLLDLRAETEVDPPPWSVADVPSFRREYESTPRSAFELNQLILWRLDDLRDQVEDADFAIRNVVNPQTSKELDLQLFVARELDRESRARYSVEREAEVAARKEPDLRIKIPGLQPVTIEMKWADDWKLAELSGALSSQLVGRYLRAADSRYGILLLAHRGNRLDWDGLDFQALVAQLRVEAMSILNANTIVDGLEIFPIQFAKR